MTGCERAEALRGRVRSGGAVRGVVVSERLWTGWGIIEKNHSTLQSLFWRDHSLSLKVNMDRAVSASDRKK